MKEHCILNNILLLFEGSGPSEHIRNPCIKLLDSSAGGFMKDSCHEVTVQDCCRTFFFFKS